MSDPVRQLPPDPSLEQYRKQAKDLLKALKGGDPNAVARATRLSTLEAPTLITAQLVIAREHGFASWPKFKGHIETLNMDFAARVNAFLVAVASGDVKRAEELIALEPTVATANIHAATAAGESAAVESFIRQDPALATAKIGESRWEPIQFAAASLLHRSSPSRSEGICSAARLLIAAGANVNASWPYENDPKNGLLSTIYFATGHSNHPALARILLEAGADANDNESFYHSTEHRDHECLKLLMEFKVRPEKTNALKRMLDFDDLEGARLLLEYGFDPNEYSPNALHHAIIRGRSGNFVELLAEFGVDLTSRIPHVGQTPYELALRYGNQSAAEALERLGGAHALSAKERFLAACSRADEPAARTVLGEHPDIIRMLAPNDLRVLADAAMAGRAEAVRLMLDLGWPIDATGDHGATPLHWACWHGHADSAILLIERKAPLDATEPTFDATPLGWAIHGSVNCDPNQSGNGYADIVEALIKAGAAPPDAYSLELAQENVEVAETLAAFGFGDTCSRSKK